MPPFRSTTVQSAHGPPSGRRREEACPNVLPLQPWKIIQYAIVCLPRGEHPQHMLNRQAAAAYDRIAAENLAPAIWLRPWTDSLTILAD